jgi:ankyrin repeat protein
MNARFNTLVGVLAVTLLSNALPTSAADRDLRIVDAAAAQERETVRALVKQGVDVNAARADGATALLWATHWNDLEMVTLLLRAGAKVNQGDDHGVTPLARAAENASERMVDTLLTAKANANATQTSGLTPLMIAARTGNANVVKLLLAHGANVNAVTNESKVTALMWAIAEPHPAIVRTLVEGGADVRVSSTKGFTPLMYAARNGDIELARTLIAAGANVNDTASDGTHVLPFAIVGGRDQFASFLIEQGADPNGRIDGVAALHAAAGHVGTWLGDWSRRHGGGSLGGIYGGRGLTADRRLPLVKALLARGADPNARITASAMFMNYVGYPKKGAFETFACGTGDLYGATPLWVAAYSSNGGPSAQGGFGGASRAESNAEIIKALLEAGGNQHLTTDDGTTPFMVAAGLGRATYTPRTPRGERSPSAEQAVKVLLEAGADINAVNEADFTALHGAAYRGLNEVVQYLVEQGANINARDFRGRTPYRLAEGSKQSFQFQDWPETAELLKRLGANTRLGLPGTVQERAPRDAAVAAQAVQQP